MLKDDLDQLINLATSTSYASDVLAARKEYQKYTGEVYEDDKSYESQMALFLEWYIFDRIGTEKNQTVLEAVLAKDRENIAPKLLNILDGFIFNIHGLFTAKKIRDHSTKVINLFDNKQYEVIEPLGKLLFSKNGIFEGRILPYDNSYHFSGNFCFHPKNTEKFIRNEIKLLVSTQNKNKNELKIQTSKMNDEYKKLEKITAKVNKIKGKILNSHSEKKISELKNQLSELEGSQISFKESCSLLENQISIFNKQKIILEKRTKQSQLAHKLSRMRLIWERSRHIKLEDIYRS